MLSGVGIVAEVASPSAASAPVSPVLPMPRDVIATASGRTLQNATAFEAATKACVADLFKENGGHKCAIDRFGVSLRRAYNFTTLASDEQISFARVAILTSAKATAAARYLATLAGGVFVPLPAPKSGHALALMGEAARSHGEAIAEAAKALADSRVTPRESAALVKEIDEAVVALASLRGAAIAMAEGGR
jgi:hypothetical protein